MSGDLGFRPVADDDAAFLTDLAAARWSVLPLPELVAIQERAQRGAYEAEWGPAGEHIVTIDGGAVGRAWWVDREGVRYIVDVTLMPDAQRRGIGSAVFARLVTEADAAPVRCSVDRAKTGWLAHLLRSGFVETDRDSVTARLERPSHEIGHQL